MKTKLVDIGNSKGVRIPKSFIEKCRLENELDIDIVEDSIVIKKSSPNVRNRWSDSFKEMNKNDDDISLVENLSDKFDNDWEW
ncbi:MAG: AbrB/MazE/SpoVT family DNA-binding domain-containing protein [Spirochaetia bacterium]|nr:AbrB/MazE/SpoVT family DNA-binding domain-containing protein [Spirochaetia bacterium]